MRLLMRVFSLFCKPILQIFTKYKSIKPEREIESYASPCRVIACVCFCKPILQLFYKIQSIQSERNACSNLGNCDFVADRAVADAMRCTDRSFRAAHRRRTFERGACTSVADNDHVHPQEQLDTRTTTRDSTIDYHDHDHAWFSEQTRVH